MKKKFVLVGILLLVGFSVFLLSSQVVTAQVETPEGIPVQQLIVKYKASSNLDESAQAQNPDQMQRLSTAIGTELSYFRPMSGEAHVLRLSEAVSETEAEKLADRLEELPEVEYAQPDYMVFPMGEVPNTPFVTPNDPQYTNQWHYFAPAPGYYGVNAPAAWDLTQGSASIYVAVLDTGILNHADLSGRWQGGYDLISDVWIANDGDGRDSNPLDPGDWTYNNDCYSGYIGRSSSWHGTHVAGTIGAATNNGSGVAGLNWVSKIIPVRVLGRCGGYTSDIADGIRWAAGLTVTGVPTNPYPAKVINMSLGGLGACDTIYQSAVNAAYNAGSVVVVAAGNSSANASGYRPGNCDNVVTVAATNRNGNLADYSNYGATIEISAPGGDTNPITSDGVLSTLNSGTTSPSSDNYVYYQGTSMAAPHVAGIASLMLSVDPSLTPAQVLSVMQSTVTAFPVGSSCTTSNCGSGIINAGAAVAALGAPAPVLSPINNSDGDGNYTVSWAPGTLAKEEITTIHAPTAAYSIYLPIVLKNYDGTTYTLEEDDNSGFTSPTAVYMGTNTSWDATGKAPGTYFYRVKASNDEGDSGWSNIESVTVGGSSPGILNGDFESGSSNWVEFSTHGWDIIITGAPVTPRSGTYLAWLGGDYDDLSYVQQDVTISASTPYLVYWHWIGSEDVCGFDFGSVKVGNVVVDSYNLCSDENTGGWVKHSVNLGAYVGQTVTLQIRAETDSSGNSNLFVDDVSLQASASVVNDFVAPHQIQDVFITRDKWK